MPLYRRRYRKKTYKRRSYRRRAPGSSSQVKKNTKDIRFLKRLSEPKTLDAEINSTAIPILPTMVDAELDPADDYFPICPQGDTAFNREGQEVIVTGIEVQGLLTSNPTTLTTQTAQVLVLLVEDKQTNGAQLNSEDVLATVTNSVNNCSGFRDVGHRRRFRVHWKKRFILTPQMAGLNASVSTQQVLVPFSIFVKPMVRMKWKSSGTGIADVNGSTFHMLAVATQSDCSLSYRLRSHFKG